VVYQFSRNVTFDQANAYPGLAGPGTITTPTTISFNKSGPVYYNGTATTLDVLNGTPFFTETPGGDLSDSFYQYYFAFAIFDGSTNAPDVLPNGTTIQDLDNEILIQITTTPGGPLVGTVNGSYSVNFTVTGGSFTLPYVWSATGLPLGLSINSNANGSATVSGVPTQAGSYSFLLGLTDKNGRTDQWTFSITIQ
jgi:hypothetical protein